MKRSLTFWLKIPAVCCRPLLFFPPLLLLSRAGDPPAGALLAGLFALTACGWLAGGFCAHLRRRRAVLTPLSVLAAALAALLLPGHLLTRLVVATGAAVCFFAGTQVPQRGYGDILPASFLSFFIADYAAFAAVLCFLSLLLDTLPPVLGFDRLPLPSPLAPAFLAGLACYGVVRNQSNIDFLMERRRHRPGDLPPKIRRYNLALTLLCFAVILPCFLLRGFILRALRLLGHLVMTALVWIFRFVGWILSIFAMQESGPYAASGGPHLLPTGENTREGVSALWLLVPLIVLAVWLLWRSRRRIARMLRRAWARFAALLRRLFTDPARRQIAEESPFYSDRVEELSREDIRPRRRELSARRWRKAVRALANIEDPAEKYRGGYRLLLIWLHTRAAIRPGDTVREIEERTADLLPRADYDRARTVYERVRYADASPAPEELHGLMQLLETAAQSRNA